MFRFRLRTLFALTVLAAAWCWCQTVPTSSTGNGVSSTLYVHTEFGRPLTAVTAAHFYNIGDPFYIPDDATWDYDALGLTVDIVATLAGAVAALWILERSARRCRALVTD